MDKSILLLQLLEEVLPSVKNKAMDTVIYCGISLFAAFYMIRVAVNEILAAITKLTEELTKSKEKDKEIAYLKNRLKWYKNVYDSLPKAGHGPSTEL